MFKKALSISIVLVFALMVMFTGGANAQEGEDTQVGIVLSTGGLGDLSFNDAAYRGLQMAKDELGIEFDYIEPSDPSEDETSLRRFASRGYDLVIGVGFQMSDTLEIVARDYPNVNFAHVDQDFGDDILDNVVS
ncbi:MAG: BMP family lipoprotein, partial [Bacillota bacterium]